MSVGKSAARAFLVPVNYFYGAQSRRVSLSGGIEKGIQRGQSPSTNDSHVQPGDLGWVVRRPKCPRKAPDAVERLHGTDLAKDVGREPSLAIRDGFV